jgi:protein disulfide-isomerase-like protein
MRTFLLTAFALLATSVIAEDPTDSLPGVVDLTPENFDKHVNGGKHALVEFYAPWCGHCKSLTPVFKQLGEFVASSPKLKDRVVIAKVDADNHRSLGEKFGVKGFPTLKWFARGKPVATPVDYNSARSIDAFKEYINSAMESDKGWARVESLDTLVKEYLAAGSDTAASVIEKIEEAAGKLTGDSMANGAYYVKYLKKAAEKGNDFFKTEYDRLERLLSGGKVSSNKLSEISQKLSVLSAFSSGDDDDKAASEE